MFDQDPDGNIGFLLHDVSRRLRERFDRRARAMGLTRAQWRVLVHLGPRQGINQAALAEILELDTVSLGRHVDRLEDAGWLQRRPDPDDRRAWCLHLTEKSAPIVEQMEALVVQTQKEALGGIAEVDRAHMLKTLQMMKQNMQTTEDAARAADEALGLAPAEDVAGVEREAGHG